MRNKENQTAKARAKLIAAQLKEMVDGYIYFHAASLISKAAASDTLFEARYKIRESFGHVSDDVIYSMDSYYCERRADKAMLERHDELWAIGALQLLACLVEKSNDLKRSPIIELIIHLRNGVIRGGNELIFDDENELRKRPANNFAYAKSMGIKKIKLLASYRGRKILFDFVSMTDLILLFKGVIDYYNRYEPD